MVRRRPASSLLDAGHPELPTDPTRHTSAIAASAVLDVARRRGAQLPAAGIALSVRQGAAAFGRPGRQRGVGRGRRGRRRCAVRLRCSTSDVAAAVLPRSPRRPSRAGISTTSRRRCSVDRARALGRSDRRGEPADPRRVVSCWRHPSQRIRTSEARARAARLAAALGGAASDGAGRARSSPRVTSSDLALLGRAIDDRIAEPAARAADAGLPGREGSGDDRGRPRRVDLAAPGPTAFALVAGDEVAERVADGDARGVRTCRRRILDSCHPRRPQRRGRDDRMSMPVQTLTPSTAAEQMSIVRCASCHATLDDRTARATCAQLRRPARGRAHARAAAGEALRARFDDRLGSTSSAARQRSAPASGASASSCCPARATRRSSPIPKGTRPSSRARRWRASPACATCC